MNGWIKIHRSILNWGWSGDDSLFAFWIKLLMVVNFEDRIWKGKLIKAGQIITSHEMLSTTLGVSISSTKRYLKKLSETGEITIESRRGLGTVITVLKYVNYQILESKGLEDPNIDLNSDLNSDLYSDLLLKKERKKKKRTLTGGAAPTSGSEQISSFPSEEKSQMEYRIDSLTRWNQVLEIWKSSEADYILKASCEKYWMKYSADLQMEILQFLQGLGSDSVHLSGLWISSMMKNKLLHPGQIQTEIGKAKSRNKPGNEKRNHINLSRF